MASTSEIRRIQDVYRARENECTRAHYAPENPGNRAILRERTRLLEQMLRSAGLLPLSEHRILEVGCGSGGELARLIRWGARPENLHGVDLLENRIQAARQMLPEIHFQQGNAEQLDFPGSSFKLVLLSTLFTSILDRRMAANVAREVTRVLEPGGAVVWYDFRWNNPWNPNVRGMSRRAIQRLFPDFDLRLRAVTLLPPLARRLGRMTPVLYPLLTALPHLRAHYLGLLQKRQGVSPRRAA